MTSSNLDASAVGRKSERQRSNCTIGNPRGSGELRARILRYHPAFSAKQAQVSTRGPTWAGWMLSDYDAANLPYDSAAVRVDRLEESAKVLKGLFGPTSFSMHGKHYQISELDGLPKPVQRPHPPMLLGGGRQQVLSVAARLADIVGINPSQRPGVIVPHEALDQTAERIDAKVGWVRAAAAAAGRSMDEIELQMRLLSFRVCRSAAEARSSLAAMARRLRVDPALLEESPALLHGTVEQCVETLQARRERFGSAT